jgi:hypothetical protein
VLDVSDILLLNDDFVNIGIVITPVSTEVLLALRARYYDADDKRVGSPLIVSVSSGNISRQGCTPCINEQVHLAARFAPIGRVAPCFFAA